MSANGIANLDCAESGTAAGERATRRAKQLVANQTVQCRLEGRRSGGRGMLSGRWSGVQAGDDRCGRLHPMEDDKVAGREKIVVGADVDRESVTR